MINKSTLISIAAILILIFTILGCSAPKPPKVSLAGGVKPINFTEADYNNRVIKSEQASKTWRKQFAYSIHNNDYSPEFFYAIAHADKIIAIIKPPHVDYVFAQVEKSLKDYGITIQLELIVSQDKSQTSQVILDCAGLNHEQ